VGYLKRQGPILVAILVAILVTALMAPAGETWSESPISPPPTPEQWELDLEEERYEREHPQPTPRPRIEICEVYVPRLGWVRLPCKYADGMIEWWSQLIP
jgi:hypothetical protein